MYIVVVVDLFVPHLLLVTTWYYVLFYICVIVFCTVFCCIGIVLFVIRVVDYLCCCYSAICLFDDLVYCYYVVTFVIAC
jgi:hypothetical protein